ncbi:MAG: hypothetical protein ISS67_05255, partial [Desulfobacterales bacterium]|nr:hypothetical protein [Desulfobacterales bacterium]
MILLRNRLRTYFVTGYKSINSYVALDVETTGLSPKSGDRVIEIGAVAIEDQSIIAEFSSLIDVDKMIP